MFSLSSVAKPHPQLQSEAFLCSHMELHEGDYRNSLIEVENLVKCRSPELAGGGGGWGDVQRIWNFSSIESILRDLLYSMLTVSVWMEKVPHRSWCLYSWFKGALEPLGGGAYLDEEGQCGHCFWLSYSASCLLLTGWKRQPPTPTAWLGSALTTVCSLSGDLSEHSRHEKPSLYPQNSHKDRYIHL